MEALLGRLDPLMAVLVMGGMGAITWLARQVLRKDDEAREDRHAYLETIKENTAVMTKMGERMEQLAQTVAMALHGRRE